jgi:hypothetical protein
VDGGGGSSSSSFVLQPSNEEILYQREQLQQQWAQQQQQQQQQLADLQAALLTDSASDSGSESGMDEHQGDAASKLQGSCQQASKASSLNSEALASAELERLRCRLLQQQQQQQQPAGPLPPSQQQEQSPPKLQLGGQLSLGAGSITGGSDCCVGVLAAAAAAMDAAE